MISPVPHLAYEEYRASVDAAHDRANREAILEHARLGFSVPEGDGQGRVVWITPAQIFARYGFDEFGRPLPTAS